MKKPDFSRFFDKLLTGPFFFQILSLLFLIFIIISLASAVLILLGIEVFESVWWSFLRLTDFSTLVGDQLPFSRVFGAVLALMGWVIFGLLISIIAAAIQHRIKAIQKGTGGVKYKNHTIILGWNRNIFSILDEFTHEKEKNEPPLVVMAKRSAEEMYGDIKSFCQPETVKNVVCRFGNPDSIADQKKVNVAKAKELIILNNIFASQESDFLDTDADSLKSVLAYSKNIKEEKGRAASKIKSTHIIVDLLQPLSLELMKGIMPNFQEVKRDIKITTIPSHQILGRILAQCSFQPGLSEVYEDLFSYKEIEKFDCNVEIYSSRMKDAGVPEKMSFNELYSGFPEATLFGYRKSEEDRAVVNPDWDSEEANCALVPEEDILFFIAEGQENLYFQPENNQQQEIFPRKKPGTSYLEQKNVLIYGEGFKALEVIVELDDYLPPGSKVTCSKKLKKFNGNTFDDLELNFWDMEEVESLFIRPSQGDISSYDIIIMAQDANDPLRHDSFSLMNLSGLLSICDDENDRPRIVMDLLDINNAELAKTARADDVIIGTEMISDYLFQIARDYNRYLAFQELLNSEGAEIYFKPLSLYLEEDEEYCFDKVMHAARRRDEVLIGHSWKEPEGRVNWWLNPVGKERSKTNSAVDKVIVIAEEGD